jgi:UDP-sugar pyrophosphorylase
LVHTPGEDDERKRALVGQLARANASYHGGLPAYLTNARQLLADSKEGE